MLQAILTYLLVAAAAAWVAWSIFTPKALRRAVRARLAGARPVPSGKAGCDCGGDGGCH